jgi:hypothetical protein
LRKVQSKGIRKNLFSKIRKALNLKKFNLNKKITYIIIASISAEQATNPPTTHDNQWATQFSLALKPTSSAPISGGQPRNYTVMATPTPDSILAPFPGRGTTLSDQHHHHQGKASGYTGQVNKHRGTASAVYSPGTSSRTQAE